MEGARRKTTVVIVGAGILLASAAGYFKWRDTQAFYRPEQLLSRFPAEEAILLSADFSLLRPAGYLAASKAPPEAEYRQFVTASGFDYRRDLDQAWAAFTATGNYFIARGRFNWARLREYAASQGGSCYQELCRMQGSTPERRISFLPLRPDTIAIAVSTDDLAVTRLTKAGLRNPGDLPAAPVWLTIPGTALRKPDALPSGLRVMFSGIVHADKIVFTLGAAASGAEARMEATCGNEEQARILTSQLANSVSLLKEAAAKGGENGPATRALSAGAFRQNGRIVTGRWPLAKDLIDNLTAGL